MRSLLVEQRSKQWGEEASHRCTLYPSTVCSRFVQKRVGASYYSLLFLFAAATSEKRLLKQQQTNRNSDGSKGYAKTQVKRPCIDAFIQSLSPQGIAFMAGPLQSPNKTQIQKTHPPGSPHTHPIPPPPYWIQQGPIREESYSKQDSLGRAPRGACHGPWAGLGNPRSGWIWSRGFWARVKHSSGLQIDIYPKPGSNREGKNPYIAKSYGTLSEHESQCHYNSYDLQISIELISHIRGS